MQSEEIARIVSEVLQRLEKDDLGSVLAVPSRAAPAAAVGPSSDDDVLFSSVDAAVQAARRAQAEFQEQGLERRCGVIRAMRKEAVANAERLAKLAREETGMGSWDDKVQKNLVCATGTPGVETWSRAYTETWADLVSTRLRRRRGDHALDNPPPPSSTTGSPSWRPTTRSSSPHPASFNLPETMRVLSRRFRRRPRALITTTNPRRRTRRTSWRTRTRASTWSGAREEVAMTVGKTCKTIAAGPKPPVVVDETANFPKCASGVIFGASFDNNVLCTAEKEVIVTEAARSRFLEAMRQPARLSSPRRPSS